MSIGVVRQQHEDLEDSDGRSPHDDVPIKVFFDSISDFRITEDAPFDLRGIPRSEDEGTEEDESEEVYTESETSTAHCIDVPISLEEDQKEVSEAHGFSIQVAYIAWKHRTCCCRQFEIACDTTFGDVKTELFQWLQIPLSEMLYFFVPPANSAMLAPPLPLEDLVCARVHNNGTVFCNAVREMISEGEVVEYYYLAFCLMMTTVGKPVMCAPPLVVPAPFPAERAVRAFRLAPPALNHVTFSVRAAQQSENESCDELELFCDDGGSAVAAVLPAVHVQDYVLYHYGCASKAGSLAAQEGSLGQPRAARVDREYLSGGGLLSFDVVDIPSGLKFEGVLGVELELL